MTRRQRQRNNDQKKFGKTKKTITGGKFLNADDVNNNINVIVKQYLKSKLYNVLSFEKQPFDGMNYLKTEVPKLINVVKKENQSFFRRPLMSITLESLKKEVSECFDNNYKSVNDEINKELNETNQTINTKNVGESRGLITIPHYLTAVKSYNEQRKMEIYTTYGSNFVNSSLSVIGFTSMVSVTDAIVTAGPSPTLEQIGIIKDSATNVGNVVKIVAIGLGATLSAAISSTGLGFLILFTLLGD